MLILAEFCEGGVLKVFRATGYILLIIKIIIPIVLLVIAGAFIFINKGFNFGIDFTGGTDITITNAKDASIKSINKDIKGLGYTIISSESDNDGYYIKVSEILDKEDINKVNNMLETNYEAKTDISVVSNLKYIRPSTHFIYLAPISFKRSL